MLGTRLLALVLCLLSLPALVRAQMTIQGTVTTSAGAPVADALVSISALDIDARTGDNGRYSFIIRTTQVRGQAVAIVARHARFGTQSVEIQITGGSLIQNFVLAPGSRVTEGLFANLVWPGAAADAESMQLMRKVVPASSFEAQAGPLDVMSALAGHIPGLQVTSAMTAGGSAPAIYRGPRSFAANTQPLVIVDGIAIDNQSHTNALQRFGLGGFDYGTPLQDLSLDDVESVVVLDPAVATMLYGSRAANGVIAVTTKSGREITGLHFSATQRFTSESPTRVPSFQNQYGQGLGGEYEFFDGQGGGINDDVAENWGPKLDARPITQHSLNEPRRPDVRYWLPQPGDVRDHFGGGRTMHANVAMVGSIGPSNLRASVNGRDVGSLSPGFSARQLGFALNGATRPFSSLRATANFQFIRSNAKQRAGTGFHELNPVAGFTRMGRQVDLDALQELITDENGEQINWIYTDRNNPYFATSRNSNDDSRQHLLGGTAITYDLSSSLRANLHVAVLDYSEKRRVSIDSGWKGGYPGLASPGAFSGGGSDNQSLGIGERTARVSLLGVMQPRGLRVAASAGAEFRINEFETSSTITDILPGGGSTVDTEARSGSASVTSFFAMGALDRGSSFNINAGARMEQASRPSDVGSSVYPFASARYDFAPQLSMLASVGIGTMALRASWWRAGNELSDRILAGVFFGGDSVGIAESALVGPERTEGMEFGVELAAANDRIGLDLAGYRDRSTGLLLATRATDGSAIVSQTGEIFNGGYEATLRASPISTPNVEWNLATSYAHNTNTVDALRDGESRVSISPTLFGAAQVAQVGSPVGLIVGTRYLRDAGTGSLILRNGLPIPDANNTLSVLGSWQPDWTASFQSKLRYGQTELQFLVDTRMGGKIFSATNLWGGYSGTLDFTLAGREDSLLIAGIDSVTGAANTTRVTAQDYFHSLGAIHEAWVYDASYAKLREARITYTFHPRSTPGFRDHNLRVSLIGRNLYTWAKAPNIDPETALSVRAFQGFEMGQLPSARSVGLQLSIAP